MYLLKDVKAVVARTCGGSWRALMARKQAFQASMDEWGRK